MLEPVVDGGYKGGDYLIEFWGNWNVKVMKMEDN